MDPQIQTWLNQLFSENQQINVQLLDEIVSTAFNPSSPHLNIANQCLMTLQSNDSLWQHVDTILESSQHPQTRFFALQILEATINSKWKILPEEQRSGIKNYIVSKVIESASTQSSSLYLNKLNLVLIGIVKQEWPDHWTSFVSDIVGSSRTSEQLCENNMKILTLLSEDVFDYGSESMTRVKHANAKQALNNAYTQIFQLCEFVLQKSTNVSLLRTTLLCLQRYLTWIPLGFIFQTGLLDALSNKFLADKNLCNETIDCLTEIAILENDSHEYDGSIIKLIIDVNRVLKSLGISCTAGQNILNEMATNMSEREEKLVHKLGLFYSGYFKRHLSLLENVGPDEAIYEGLSFLLRISEVRDEEVYKICVDAWHNISHTIYKRHNQQQAALYAQQRSNVGLRLGGGNMPDEQPSSGIKPLYKQILHDLRLVLISRMSQPEEVLISTDDDDSTITRVTTRDTEQLHLYKIMRETLVYLTHLDTEDTESIMLSKLSKQVDTTEWSWFNLNTLCWAVGSISGSMSEEEEKRFLVTVIKDLLGLCEMKRGKDNKAVVASNIMYVVGQYPRFLRAHWKFLKTVVNKLFEFMHELHPGVQDMACDTFLKISQKCKRKFMTTQVEESRPFVCELVESLESVVSDLEDHQVQSFYESCATMLSDKTTIMTATGQHIPHTDVLAKLMQLPNNSWKSILANANRDENALANSATLKEIMKILKTNNRVVQTVGSLYTTQLKELFADLLNLYRYFSEYIFKSVQTQGPIAIQMSTVRIVRAAKREIVKLFTAFINKSSPPEAGPAMVAQQILPPVFEPFLTDYSKSLPDARDMEILQFTSVVVSKLKGEVNDQIPKIFEYTFQSTLEMITANFEDFPDHRLQFYIFLKSVIKDCFSGLFTIPSEQQKLVVDSIVWAMKHADRNISEMGAEILYDLLQNVERTPSISQGFYQQFLLSLIQDVFAGMTDRLHKSLFRMHATLLRHMFHLVQMNQVTVPLFDPSSAPPGQSNPAFLRNHVCNLLKDSFPQLTQVQIATFVDGMFDIKMDIKPFKHHLRDFLIQLQEFSTEDNTGLYQEENDEQRKQQEAQMMAEKSAIPGLIKPNEIEDEDL